MSRLTPLTPVSIYERRDFKVEVGASISCAANGGKVGSRGRGDADDAQWLREWDVDVARGKPVELMKLVMRDWDTGKILNQYDLDHYEQDWGIVSAAPGARLTPTQPYYMFHRVDMHEMLLEAATSPNGQGIPASVVVDHIATSVDYDKGEVTFANGNVIRADMIIGADGIRVSVALEIAAHAPVRCPPRDWRGATDEVGQPDMLPRQRAPVRH